jgi:hypothetical protein
VPHLLASLMATMDGPTKRIAVASRAKRLPLRGGAERRRTVPANYTANKKSCCVMASAPMPVTPRSVM